MDKNKLGVEIKMIDGSILFDELSTSEEFGSRVLNNLTDFTFITQGNEEYGIAIKHIIYFKTKQ